MVNPIPHDQYQNNNQAQIRRLERVHKKNWQMLFGFSLVIIIVLLLISLAGKVGVLDFSTDDWGLPSFLVAITSIGLFVWFGGKFLDDVTNELFEEYNFACPHCEEIFNVGSKWRCGWCSHLHKTNKSKVAKTLFQGCVSCGEQPTAIMCPICANDIMLDDRYDKVQQKGFGFEGTATELQAADTNK